MHEPAKSAAAPGLVPVDYQHSGNLPDLLAELGVSLIVSTYQAGKVFTVGSHQGKLQFRFHQFDQPMGLARTPTGLAIGTRQQIWFLRAATELAPRIAPAGNYDGCFLARHAHYTGPIMGHDLAWGDGELWVANTLFSCLAVVHPDFNFAPRWLPPFISGLASQDRCHLNGVAVENGKPRFITALGETDTPAGWRPGKATGGCLVEVAAKRTIARGLCMPHSPRVHQAILFLLNSGRGEINRVNVATGSLQTIAELPGYTRGLDCFGRFAFVGLSRIRETSVFGGLPIAERKKDLRCGVAVIDWVTGLLAATLFFQGGVEEIFEVKVLPGFRNPFLAGPTPDVDRQEYLWVVPPLNTSTLSSQAEPTRSVP